MTWHIDPGLLADYIDDELDYARSASVEAHLTGCGTCQAGAAPGRLRGVPRSPTGTRTRGSG